MDAAGLQFALGGLFLRHWLELKRRFLGHDQHLDEWLPLAEDVGLPFRRRFEHQEIDHRPPAPDQCGNSDRGCVGRVGVKPGVGLGSDRPSLVHLEIERELVGVIEVAEGAERRPLAAIFARPRPEIAVKSKFTVADGDAKLVLIRVKQLDPVACALRKRQAMPGLLRRSALPRLALAAPAGDFEFGTPRIEAGRE